MNTVDHSKPWTFVHVSDMHVGSPRSFRFQPAWNENWDVARKQIIALKPDCLFVGGDMTRDGTTHVEELTAALRDFEQLPFPVHAIPGNHEVGNKYSEESTVAIRSAYVQQYRRVFGPSEWSLVHGEGENAIRFTGFDAFLLGSGLPEELELRNWLDTLANEPAIANHVWIIHPALFADHPDEPDFDPAIDRVPWYFALDRAVRNYALQVMRATGVTHVISGHIHCRRVVNWEGIEIHFAPSTAFPQWGDRWPDGDDTLGFLHFTVADGKLISQFVPLDHVSDRVGYGPGGNPPIEGRDYSVAWEKPPLVPVRTATS